MMKRFLNYFIYSLFIRTIFVLHNNSLIEFVVELLKMRYGHFDGVNSMCYKYYFSLSLLTPIFDVRFSEKKNSSTITFPEPRIPVYGLD